MINPHEAEEEVEKLKSWWREYGHFAIAGVLLGLALLVGYRYWDAYVESQRAAASARYEELLEAVQRGDTKAALGTGAALIETYPRTPYAGMAALLLARLHVEAGELEAARERLAWAIEHGRDPASVIAARLRLARLLLSEGKTEEALARLEGGDYLGFESEYHELRGDLYRRAGRLDEARDAYARALEHSPANSAYRAVLRMKHDDIGERRS